MCHLAKPLCAINMYNHVYTILYVCMHVHVYTILYVCTCVSWYVCMITISSLVYIFVVLLHLYKHICTCNKGIWHVHYSFRKFYYNLRPLFIIIVESLTNNT